MDAHNDVNGAQTVCHAYYGADNRSLIPGTGRDLLFVARAHLDSTQPPILFVWGDESQN
jgi:hypothetical protein